MSHNMLPVFCAYSDQILSFATKCLCSNDGLAVNREFILPFKNLECLIFAMMDMRRRTATRQVMRFHRADHAAGVAGLTVVLPIVVGRLSSEEGFTWDTLAIGSTSLTFDIDGFRP